MAALPHRYPLFRPRNSHFYPPDEHPVYRPSLARCSSGRDRCWPESLTTPERESSRADICLSALATHTSTPQAKPSSPGPPSRTIPLGQLGTCWQCPLLQNGSPPASIFAFTPSQFTFLSPVRNISLPGAPERAISRRQPDIALGRFQLRNVSSPASVSVFPPSQSTLLPLARNASFPGSPSHAIPSRQLDVGWCRSQRQNASFLVSTFNFLSSDSAFLLARKTSSRSDTRRDPVAAGPGK